MNAVWSLLHGIGLDLKAEKAAAPARPLPTRKNFLSDTGQLRWDVSEPGAGYFTVDTPRTKLFTGFVRGRTFHLGNVVLAVGSTRLDWATVTMAVIEGQGFDGPGRILIAATGLVHNKGANLQTLDGKRVTLGDHWGEAPILCEGIPAEILLPAAADRVTVYPLDPAGNRRSSVQPAARDGRAVIAIGLAYKTLWYEVELR